MAKYTIAHPWQDEKEEHPDSDETFEVRVWGLGGAPKQFFSIGSGSNFRGDVNYLLEVIYSVQGISVFYTRNYLHLTQDFYPFSGRRERLEKFRQGDVESFGLGDTLPDTSIVLKRTTYSYPNSENPQSTSMSYELIVGLDVGVVFGFELPPGNQHIDIKFDDIVLDEGVKFCGEILNELESAYAGNHLNPASLPQGSSDWPFVKLLNSQAYDRIADTYQERYFENPLLKTAFEAWLNLIPPGANVLDAGCGHGDPVIKRLLRKGFAVTGTDISPRMLDLARKNARRAKYLNLAIAEVTAEAEFSAVCSFSSMLYQDPIDFFTSIYRIHCALKPGGLLFLYAYDLHPSWRGLPYDKAINQWMWSWTYSKQEVKGALEEHGYFEVLDSQSVITPEEKELQIARWRENKQKEYEQLVEKYPDYAKAHPLDVSSPPDNLTYPYFVIARKRG